MLQGLKRVSKYWTTAKYLQLEQNLSKNWVKEHLGKSTRRNWKTAWSTLESRKFQFTLGLGSKKLLLWKNYMVGLKYSGSRFFEPARETEIGLKNRGWHWLKSNPREMGFGSNNREVQKFRDSKNRDSTVVINVTKSSIINDLHICYL